MVVIMRISHGPRGERLGDAPMLIRDHLDDMISPLDGKPQTSKRAYYRSLKEAGCDIDDRGRMRESNRSEYSTDGLREAIGAAISNPMPEEKAIDQSTFPDP